MALDLQTKDRTGFQTPDANWVFNKVPMGSTGTVNFSQNVMQKVLDGMTS
jgi:hypothetical protein